MLKIMLLWFKITATKAAKKVFALKFTPNEIKLILKDYWQEYKNLRTDIESLPTLGGTLMVHLAAMSTAFYGTMIEKGVSEKEATEYFYSIAWQVYQKMGRFSWSITRLKFKSNDKRLKYATELFRSFPFNSPSYQWKNIPQADGTVRFNCEKCPVAEYFETKGLSDFCVNTWCALDFPLARMWNAELERKNSIAGGAKICDFKWKPNN